MFCLYILLGVGQVRTERDVGMSLIGNQYPNVCLKIGRMCEKEWFGQVDATAINPGQVVTSFPLAHHYYVPETGNRDARCRLVSVYVAPPLNSVFM